MAKPNFRRKSDRAVRERSALTRIWARVLDHAHVMLRDPDGKIHYWARGLEHLYGYSSGEAVGQISHKLLRTEFPQPLQDIERELVDAGEWSGRLAHRKRDGTLVTVASHWTLWSDELHGKLVTEVNNPTTERELSQQYLASIVESTDDAVIGKTLDGIITSWNNAAARIFGYEAHEVCGKPVTILIPIERMAEERHILEQIGRGKKVDHFESVRLRKTGEEITVSLSISPIRNITGQIIGASKIARDITDQRRTEQQLALLQSELAHATRLGTMGQMTAAIAHELNQPLAAISNYLSGIDRLFSQTGPPENITNALAAARAQTTRAGEIIRRLRDFTIRKETARRLENINEIVEHTLRLALVDAKLREIEIRIALATDLSPVLVDKIQISQVVHNLVRNALEAMEGSTERVLTISTTLDPTLQLIRLGIADSGPGLPPEVKNRLFQPFVTTKEKGMGIGLSICYGIIESHGGSLSAEPNKPTGTIFCIHLPAAIEPA